jgi:hypothetical protein
VVDDCAHDALALPEEILKVADFAIHAVVVEALEDGFLLLLGRCSGHRLEKLNLV